MSPTVARKKLGVIDRLVRAGKPEEARRLFKRLLRSKPGAGSTAARVWITEGIAAPLCEGPKSGTARYVSLHWAETFLADKCPRAALNCLRRYWWARAKSAHQWDDEARVLELQAHAMLAALEAEESRP